MRDILTIHDEALVIRAARYGDVETIVKLGKLFFDEAQWSDVTTWDDDSIRVTLGNLIENDDGILLVCSSENKIIGMAGGLVHPAYFNHHHKTGQELFWWIDPAHRGGCGGKLLDRLEAEAKKRGAQSWSMISLAKVRPEAVGRLYERRGYRASEHTYIKALGA